MIKIRRNNERGFAEHGWLQSKHTFSFAGYHDSAFMGVSALRVINDDKVVAGAGFSTHSHQDMEIISYVKKGVIEHKDSMGNVEILPAGEFQLMSAGTGVTHSEYNPSADEVLEFLQIWVEPNELGITPGYQQKQFAIKPGLQLIASPKGEDASFIIHQDAFLYQLRTEKDQRDSFDLAPERVVYIHVVSGSINIEGETLLAGDGATVAEVDVVKISGNADSEALVFDLP